MNRILVSSSNAMTPIHLTFGVNPSFYDAQDKTYVSKVDILHRPDLYQRGAFDDRIRTLRWVGYDVDKTEIEELTTYFRSIEGEIRYFKFDDLSLVNTAWPSSAVSVIDSRYKKARVITIDSSYKPGGKFAYNNIDLKIKPER